MVNLDWIEEFVEALPKAEIPRRNLIDIAGYPKWENVNSNLLAFYFDAKEEHRFQRLFINSLLDLIESKKIGDFDRTFFETEFPPPEREYRTNRGGRIDIVLFGKSDETEEESEADSENSIADWAILIENKIYAGLDNNLDEYWDSVEAKNKVGIVLSINFVTPSSKNFLNILHSELIDQIQKNLHEFYLLADDRHLLFLKEYISNIQRFYNTSEVEKDMDTILHAFHTKGKEIQELKKVDEALLQDVANSLNQAMITFDFESNQSKAKSYMHFYIRSESKLYQKYPKVAKKFRFWIRVGNLRYSPILSGYFEIFGGKENTKYGDALKEQLDKQHVFSGAVTKGGRSQSGYCHIYSFEMKIEDVSEGITTQLEKVLSENIFNNDNNKIEKAINEFQKIYEADKDKK